MTLRERSEARSGPETGTDVGAQPVLVRRSQTDRAAKRRAEILEAAAEVFSANGFRNGSLADIAARVGITHQGILHHFGSKEQLLVEVLRARDANSGREYEQADRPKGADFLRHVLWTVGENTNRSGIVAVYTVLSAESVTEGHPAQDWFRYRYGVLREDLAGALADLAGPGEQVTDDEFRRAASALIAVMDGLQVQWLLDPDQVDMPAAVRATVNAFLASWSRPELSD
jgi:AcrR family transcriptional regulator